MMNEKSAAKAVRSLLFWLLIVFIFFYLAFPFYWAVNCR